MHVTLNVREASVSPPFFDSVNLDLRVSHIGNPSRPLTLEATVLRESTLDSFRIRAESDLRKDRMSAKLRFAGRGLRLAEAGVYLEAVGVETSTVPLDLSGEADLTLQTVAGRPGVLQGALAASNINLAAAGETAATLARA